MNDFESSTESLDISSSSEIHQNIDEKSYKSWKRQIRKEERNILKERLKNLENKSDLSQEEIKEKNDIIEKLKTKYTIKSEDSFRTLDPLNIENEDSGDILVKIIENPKMEYFSEVIGRNNINLDEMEELILYNLSENIKEGNDEMGVILSRLCLLLGYFKTHGKGMLDRLIDELKIPEKKQTFIEDVKKYYNESKNAILNMSTENN